MQVNINELHRCTAFLVPHERNITTLFHHKRNLFYSKNFTSSSLITCFIRFHFMQQRGSMLMLIYIPRLPPRPKHLRLHIMAKNIDFLVCFSIMVLDIIAGILGIQAEVAQNKVCPTFLQVSKISLVAI